MSSGPDFSLVLGAVDGATAVTAVVAAAAVFALVGFATWGSRKVARFFGDSGSNAYGPHGNGDRTISGFLSSGGDSVGRGQWHPDNRAVSGSVDRHLRKRG